MADAENPDAEEQLDEIQPQPEEEHPAADEEIPLIEGTAKAVGHRSDNEDDSDSSDSEEQDDPNARKIYIRVVFLKVGDIDTVRETFLADVFIEAKWREPSLDGQTEKAGPVNIEEYWNPQLIVDNLVDDGKVSISHCAVHDKDNGNAYIVEKRRVKGTFHETMELYKFPFDTQDLAVTLMSALSDEQVVLHQDPNLMSIINVDSFEDVQEWKLYNEVQIIRSRVARFYELDTTENQLRSVLSFRTHASRLVGYYVTSIFITMFLIISLTFCSFSIDHNDQGSRLSTSMVLLLTSVTFTFTVSSSLPRISYLTSADVYLSLTALMLILVCVWHTVIVQLDAWYGKAFADTADKYALIGFGGLYVMGQLAFLIATSIKMCIRNMRFGALERKHKKKLDKEAKRGKAADCGASTK